MGAAIAIVLVGGTITHVSGVLIEDESFFAHETGKWHPESPSRLRAIHARIADRPDLQSGLDRAAAPAATPASIHAVHDPDYVKRLTDFGARGGGHLDPDTVMSERSMDAALRAAGAGLQGVQEIRDGADFGFCLVRPPGHHALAARAMGFCLLNNVAITARALRDDGNRVAILDWDAHHGNGTQEIFYSDPDVVYISMHEFPQYPGTGRLAEVGEGEGAGRTLNLPFPPGTGEHTYLRGFDEVVAPTIAAFKPAWILVSAGYDAHRADPLCGLGLRTRTFALLADRIRDLAGEVCGGKLLLFLEGGYDLEALADSVEATLWHLSGENPHLGEDVPAGPATAEEDKVVEAARSIMESYWEL